MTFSTKISHAQGLVIFYNTGELTQSDLDKVLAYFRRADFPAHYDMLTLFDDSVTMALDHTVLVNHAIERQRTLLERMPERTLKSALVGVPDALRSLLDMWPAFFPQSDQMLTIRLFDTQSEALDWLERAPLIETDLVDYPARLV